MTEFRLKITNELIERLTDDGEKMKKRTRKSRPKVPNEPRRKVPASPGWPVPPQIVLPAQPSVVHPASAELDAIRSVIHESEQVLEKLQKKEEHMKQEVTERAKDLHDKEFKLPYQKPMPCLADYEACRTCYKEHINDILKCSPLTKSYYECVRRLKQQAGAAADK